MLDHVICLGQLSQAIEARVFLSLQNSQTVLGNFKEIHFVEAQFSSCLKQWNQPIYLGGEQQMYPGSISFLVEDFKTSLLR